MVSPCRLSASLAIPLTFEDYEITLLFVSVSSLNFPFLCGSCRIESKYVIPSSTTPCFS